MERALGEVPHVERVFWDWRNQVGYVRFRPGEVAEAAALRKAIDERTMFRSGEVVWLERASELPDGLR